MNSVPGVHFKSPDTASPTQHSSAPDRNATRGLGTRSKNTTEDAINWRPNKLTLHPTIIESRA